MAVRKKPIDSGRLERAVKAARQHRERRAGGFREQALKLFPWICARCGREFTDKNLRELTVHHKDHDHGNNPSDGSNWELLCLYCHEQEHDHLAEGEEGGTARASAGTPATRYRPFEDLDRLLKSKK